jgi:MoaA/NifB/PqqE/SkfB family radical SAM enzyme
MEAFVILEKTEALCNHCFSAHAADLVRNDNRIEAVIHCPEGEFRHELSSDADMFMEIRNRSSTDFKNIEVPKNLRYVLNYISITNACNLNCTVCGADAKPNSSDAVFLSVDEICRRAEYAKKQGGRILHLFGGEPTIHPEILLIVERISRMGFSTGIVTNGFRLGMEHDLARKLKARGLARICLQFDSLNPDTLNRLGRNFLDAKKQAIRNAIAADLNVGLNCTVTSHNLNEIGELLSHGLEVSSRVRNMTFASAAPIGRYKLSPQDSTDREQIIRRLLAVGDRYSFTFDDVLPLPAYLPWGIQNHPDCGAHVVFVRTPTGIQPLNRLIDLHAVYQRMGKNRMRTNVIALYLLPVYFVLQSVRKNKWIPCLQLMAGLLMAKRRYSLVNIGISNYKGAAFLDKRRIDRCSSAFHTSVGPVKGCLHFYGSQTFAGSKKYEEIHGSC